MNKKVDEKIKMRKRMRRIIRPLRHSLRYLPDRTGISFYALIKLILVFVAAIIIITVLTLILRTMFTISP